MRLFDARALEVLGGVLVHSLWQGAFVAGAAGVALTFLKRPGARYLVASLALAALLLWPGMTALRLAAVDTTRTAQETTAAVSSGAAVADDPTASSSVATTFPLQGTPHVAAPVPASPASSPPAPTTGWTVAFAAVWLAGVLAGLARLALGLTFTTRLRRSGRAADPRLVEVARKVAARMGLRLHVTLLETRRVSSPVVIGVLRPALLLPAGLAPTLPPAQLEAVMAHELAHVLRRDFLMNLLQRLVETLMFHHPAAWWLSRVVRVEREHLCDDAAVRSVGGDPLPLAKGLAALATARGNAPLVSVGAADGDLLARVKRLLARGGQRQGPTARALRASTPALLLALLAVAAPLLVPPASAHGTATGAAERETPSDLPFELRYGNHFDLGGAPFQLLFLHVNLEPDIGASVAPATVRVLDSAGEVLVEREMNYAESMGGWPALAASAAAVEVTTKSGSWTVPLEVRPAPDGFGPVEAIEVIDQEGGSLLTWDAVPGAATYRARLVHDVSNTGVLLYSREPVVSLAGLEPGSYRVTIEAFSHDPLKLGQVLPMDYATSTLGSIRVPRANADTAARGAVEGRALFGNSPAAGLAVNLYPSAPHRTTSPAARSTVTDSEGRYRFENVPPGNYNVSPALRPPNDFGLPVRVPTTTFSVAPGRVTRPADLFVMRAITPLGRLQAGTANPGEVTLEWEQVPGAETYVVRVAERATSTAPGASYALLASYPLEGTTWTVTLEPQTVYEVTIQALDAQDLLVGEFVGSLRTVPAQ